MQRLGHYLGCLFCLKMADKEHTNNEMFKDKMDMFQRDKALLEAYLKGKVSCPHRPHHSCSKDKEDYVEKQQHSPNGTLKLTGCSLWPSRQPYSHAHVSFRKCFSHHKECTEREYLFSNSEVLYLLKYSVCCPVLFTSVILYQ